MASQIADGRRRPPGWGFAFAVFMIIGIGSSIMSALNYSQQAGLDQARFVEESTQAQSMVEREVREAFVALASISHYSGQSLATASPDDFSAFIEGSGLDETHPILGNGFTIIEWIPADELDEFVARERQFDPDFRVRQLVSGFDTPQVWVVTRSTADIGIGINLIGADISQMALVLPGYLPTPEDPVSILPLATFGALVGSADDPELDQLVQSASEGRFDQIVAQLIPGGDGAGRGLIISSLDDAKLTSSLESEFPSHVQVRAQLLPDAALARPIPEADSAKYASSVELAIEGTRWEVTVWGDESFANADRGLSFGFMVIGWIFASIISVGLLLRYRGLGELEHVQQELQATSELAGSDALTGLLNRTAMMEHLQHSVDTGESVGVLFLDMDRFKLINDTLGHDAGDDLLRAVAARISATVRTTDKVARFGGDEFVVMLAGVKTITEATATAQAIQDRIQQPLMLGTTAVHPVASIGVAIAAESMFLTPSELLRQADTAMYAAKRGQQSGLEVFDASMREAVVDRLALEQDLYEAVRENHLVCHFQPMVDSEKEVTGYEALAVWEHSERGLLDAQEFHEVARQSGLLSEMTAQMLETVCAAMAQLPEWLPMHVNADAHVLANPDFGKRLQVMLTQHGIKPERLVLEVTEDSLSQGAESTESTIRYLSNYGVRFAVDNFGKDQTSLSLLTRFGELCMIKLDPTMVRGVLENAEVRPIVSAIVSVAKSLDLVVAADGIETEDERQALIQMGVQTTQGPLHGAGISASELGRVAI